MGSRVSADLGGRGDAWKWKRVSYMGVWMGGENWRLDIMVIVDVLTCHREKRMGTRMEHLRLRTLLRREWFEQLDCVVVQMRALVGAMPGAQSERRWPWSF